MRGDRRETDSGAAGVDGLCIPQPLRHVAAIAGGDHYPKIVHPARDFKGTPGRP